MEKKNEAFAIVPHALTAHRGIEATTKIVLIHCLERYNTKLENGQPWTFSCPSIAAGTGLLDRTVRRQVSTLKSAKVLKPYGTMTSGKRRYEVYTFDHDQLLKWLGTAVKKSAVVPTGEGKIAADIMSAVKPNKIKASLDAAQSTADITADKSADIKSDRNKIVEGKAVAVGQPAQLNPLHAEHDGGALIPDAVIHDRGVPPLHSRPAAGGNEYNGFKNKGASPERSEARAEGDSFSQGACPPQPKVPPAAPTPVGYVVSTAEPLELFMPWNVPVTACAKRQDEIVRQMNNHGFGFLKDGPMGSQLNGHACCAYDPNDKLILVTADTRGYAQRSHVQKLCAEFGPKGWTVLLWTAKDQAVFNIVKAKVGSRS